MNLEAEQSRAAGPGCAARNGPPERPAKLASRSGSVGWAALLVGLVAAVAPAVAARAQDVSAALRSGQTESTTREVPGNDIRAGRATILVPAPLDAVVGQVTDYGHYRDFMPRFQQSRVIAGRGPNRRVYLQVSILGGRAQIWALARFFARAPRGQTQVIEGRMVEGNVDALWARWELTPVDGGTQTLVTFEMFVDPSFPAPSGLVTSQNESWAARAVRALRTRVQRSGSARASAD